MLRCFKSALVGVFVAVAALSYVVPAPLMAAAQGTTAPPNIIYVWDYLSPAERIDVANQTATLDVSTSVANAVSLVPSTGGKLVFAPGLYRLDTCSLAISKNIVVEGSGTLVYSYASFPTGSVTNIRCTQAAAPIFNVTASYASFSNIGMSCSNGSVTTGSTAILANGPSEASRVDYSNIMVDGCYDAIDNKVGNSWYMTNSILMNFKHWGVRVRNTQNADAGDWSIDKVKMYPAGSPAAACIQIESSGGGDVTGVHCLPNSGTLTSCFYMDTTGNVTQEMNFSGNKCDFAVTPINFVQSLSYIRIVNNFLRSTTANSPAITMANQGFGLIEANLLISGPGSTGEAITFSNYNRTTIGPNQINGFAVVSLTGSNNMANGGLDSFVPGQTTQTVATLPNANSVVAGTCAIVTDANSTTFHATVAGGGSNILKVCSDGTFWKIGG